MRIHSYSLLFILSLCSWGTLTQGKEPKAASQAALEERQILTLPEYAVPLLYGTDKAPVLGTILDGYLYYGGAYLKGNCTGRGLYRFALMPDQRSEPAEETVLDPETHPCISRITTDGKDLFVLVEVQTEKETKAEVKVLSEGKLVALSERFPSWSAEVRWLHHREENRSLEPWFTDKTEALLFGAQSDGSVKRLLAHPKLPQKIGLSEGSFGNPGTRRGRFRTLAGFEALSRLNGVGGFTWDQDHYGYALLKSSDNSEFSQLFVMNLATLEVNGTYGGESPDIDREPELDKAGASAFALRNAVALLPAEHGVVIEDHTDYQNEWNALYYFPNEGAKVYRVQIPPEALEGVVGVSRYEQGYLISQPGEGRIIWYGRNNPFSPKVFPPRDIRLNALSDSEVQKLSKRAGEKDE